MHSSYVVTDPKGTVLVECGKMLEKGGYVIKSLNTINFRKSMHYNPFAYIRSEKDILKLVNTIIVNTKGDGDKSGEDFWVKAEKLYYTALIGYIWYEAPEQEKNFTTLLEMINASEAREDDETFKNPVDVMFDELEAREPDHFAVKQYRKYKLAAGKTAKSMEIERGNADADAFLSGIVQMTGDLVKAYPFLSDAEAQRFGTGKEEIGKCPRCGSPVYVGKGNFYCSNKECAFCLWEDNKFFSSKKKKLTKKIAKELLDKGWCRVTGLYTPKKSQLYDAVIRLDDSGGKYVSFKMEFDR